jgi:hypothetical protein
MNPPGSVHEPSNYEKVDSLLFIVSCFLVLGSWFLVLGAMDLALIRLPLGYPEGTTLALILEKTIVR